LLGYLADKKNKNIKYTNNLLHTSINHGYQWSHLTDHCISWNKPRRNLLGRQQIRNIQHWNYFNITLSCYIF